MKISLKSVVEYFFLSLFLLLNLLFLYFTIEPKLLYHVQQPAFVFNTDFIKQHLSLPGLLSEYLAGFISQLLYYNFGGSILIVLIGTMIFAAGYFIMKQFNNKQISFLLAVLPLSFMFPLFTNYYFPLVITLNILFVYLAAALYIYLIKRELNLFISYFVIALVLYYVCGSGFFMIFSASTVIITFSFRNIKTSALFSLCVIVFAILLPYVSYKVIFNINPSTAFLSIIPEIPYIIKYEPGILLYIFCFFLPFSLIIIAFISAHNTKHDEIEEQKKSIVFLKRWGIISLSIIIIGGANYLITKMSFNNHKKNIALADYYNYHEDWTKAKEVILSDYQYDMYLNYFYNRSISHSENYIESYFSYPQLLGGDALFPDRLEAITIVLISSDYYYDLGYISQAHHWAHEAQTALPNSPRILKRLVMTNLIMGNYTAARNLLMFLNDIPYCNDFVEKYMKYTEDTSLAANDNEIKEKRYLMPEKTIVVDNFAQRMYDLLENKKNKYAYENLQMYFLLTHRLGNFIKNLPQLSLYYKNIPNVFEEAIMLYSSKTQQVPANIRISNATQNKLKGFQEIMIKYNGDKAAAKSEVRSLYSDTYLYYIVYNSPLVTKAQLKVRK